MKQIVNVSKRNNTSTLNIFIFILKKKVWQTIKLTFLSFNVSSPMPNSVLRHVQVFGGLYFSHKVHCAVTWVVCEPFLKLEISLSFNLKESLYLITLYFVANYKGKNKKLSLLKKIKT
jgi:hypothetical protein